MKRKKKWKHRVISLFLITLVIVTGMKKMVYAEDNQPQHYTVTDYTSFKRAMTYAQDGDVIMIFGKVTLGNTEYVGSNEKHLIMKRNDADSYIYFVAGDATFVNITFDGRGVKSSKPFILTGANTMTFNNCTFQNCSNSDSLLCGAGSEGGTVKVQAGSCVFNDCLFSNNYSLMGGSVWIFGDSQVEINRCIFENGGAGVCGGAVAVASSSATCEIVDSVVTNNQANYGGGVSNAGTLTVTGSKIYDNSAVNGGADIATKITGNTTLTDTVEQLNELFSADNIKVNGWVCDYDFEENIFIPDVDPTQENSLLKLDYEEIKEEPTEPPTEPTEPPTEEPGTEPTDPPTEEPGETPPTDETPDQPDKEEPDKEQPDTEEPGTKPGDQPSTENPDDGGEEEPTTKPESPSTPSNVENIITDSNNTDNSTDTVNNNNNSSVVNNNDTDRSDNSVKSNDSYTTNTTTNNYYPAEGDTLVQQAAVPNVIVVRDGDDGNKGNYSESGERSAAVGVTGTDLESSQEQVTNDNVPNIKIDAQGVDCNFEYGEDGYNISIKANQAEQKDEEKISWYQMVQTGLLVAILICLIWKPKKKES